MWSRPEYASLAALIAERTGLSFPPSRHRDVEAALGRAFGATPPQPERLLALLDVSSAARDELIAELTVGESYFFRDHGQFALLREHVLPDVASSAESRPLRLWSAGCSTGEEAYSLAVLCEELGLAGRSHVLGTDISRVRLGAASRGLYTKWSLRGVRDDAVDRYFALRDRTYELRPDLRERVDFRYLNLAEDRYPSLTSGVWGMDVILCRNVLIYFDRATIARVARRLIDSLAPDGWLILGASDPAFGELVECEVVLTRAGLAYRRPGRRRARGFIAPVGIEPWLNDEQPPAEAAPAEAAAAPVPEPQAEPEPDPWSGWLDAAAAEADASAAEPSPRSAAEVERTVAPGSVEYRARDYSKAAAEAAAAIAQGVDDVELHVRLVRSLANVGDLNGAGRAVSAGLERHRMSAELMYLHAVLLAEAGRYGDSAVAARRALYLDRAFVPAQLALAEALRRQGEAAGARRALESAGRLLASLDPDEPVPGADGETAARLRATVRAQLSVLEAA